MARPRAHQCPAPVRPQRKRPRQARPRRPECEAAEEPSEPQVTGAWDGFVRLRGETLEALAARHGGAIVAGARCMPARIVPPSVAEKGDLTPLLSARHAHAAREAAARGAALL